MLYYKIHVYVYETKYVIYMYYVQAILSLVMVFNNMMKILVFYNPFPNKPWFLRVCSTSLLKTIWEKEKLLIITNFSLSHNVFYQFEDLFSIFINFEIVICKLFHFGRVYNLLFGKGLRDQCNISGMFYIKSQCITFFSACTLYRHLEW